MMNMYPFFGPPFYRRPSPYYPNRNSGYSNLHNLNNFSNKNAESSCSPSNSRPKKQEKFNNSNFSDFSSKNYAKNRNDNLKNYEKSRNDNFKNFKGAENTSCGKSTTLPYIDSCPEDNYSSDECFEIFGLKLHFDDLLIICILFFLYQEDVKDTYLYISLILLLLS